VIPFDRRMFLAGAAGSLLFSRRAQAGGELIEMAKRPPNYEAPRSVFTARVTPTESFYVRNHYDTPAVDAASWRLKISGLVEKPIELSLNDLAKLPPVTIEAVLQCAGNGRALFRPRVAGVQWQRGAVGNAEWSGVRLADVLALVKPKSDAKFLRMQGLDRPLLSAPPFLRAIPMEKALHADTMIALRMNGAPLAPHHGSPARLVVPGWVGDDWVKWLSELELMAAEPQGFFYDTGYRFPAKPRAPGEAIPPEEMKPMTRLNVKSMIASLDDGQVIAPGAHEIVGVAFSGEAKIAKVEISTDGGKRWTRAQLEASPSKYGFSLFRHPWRAKPGRYVLLARATDETGAAQPKIPVWNPSGYLYNAMEPIRVEVRG
jgi:DMSO/TMAO reductase YedYZ molybdopterin-dependent catalytic subunit